MHLCLCSLWGTCIQRTSPAGKCPRVFRQPPKVIKPACLESSDCRRAPLCAIASHCLALVGFSARFSYWGLCRLESRSSLIATCSFWFQNLFLLLEFNFWDQWIFPVISSSLRPQLSQDRKHSWLNPVLIVSQAVTVALWLHFVRWGGASSIWCVKVICNKGLPGPSVSAKIEKHWPTGIHCLDWVINFFKRVQTSFIGE